MVEDEEKLLIYFDREEHLIRRLGSAVVSCWAKIPEDVRQLLFLRAQRVIDEEFPEHLTAELQSFLGAHLSVSS